MKKIFTLLCAAVIATATVNAEVLLNEHFAQTTETLAANENVMANPIAETGWTNVNLSGAGIYVSQETDLTYAGYKSATDGTGSAWYKAVAKAAATPLSKSITINDGSVKSVFVAGIINVSSVGAYAQSSRDCIWALGKGTASLNNTSADRFLRLNMRLGDDGTSFQLAVSKLNEATNFQPWTGDMKFNTNYLVVTEYRYVEGDKNDSVFLYINPGKDDFSKYTLISKQDTLQSGVTQKGSISQSDAPTFGSMMLISVSSVKPTLFIDELKVTTSWADLWEGGEAPKTPTIIADQSFSFGNVNVNEAANKSLTIKGSNLKGAISIASDNAQLVVSAASVTKDAAESESGASVDLTLTATAAGEGSAKITLSSEDAVNKVINVTWNAVAPVSKISIADAKKLAPDTEVDLNDVVITRIFQDGLAFTVQDATGALNLADYYGAGSSWKVGDKISDLYGVILPSEEYMEGFCTVFPISGNVAASGVVIEPLAVTLADFTKYGPAYIKVEGVSFPSDKEKFEAGGITISQDAASANMQILAGCDIIGEDVPSKADVKGIVCHPYLTDNILISASADVYNRVARSATAIENIQSKGKAVKVVRDGQLIILRDGKEYNVLGVEK